MDLLTLELKCILSDGYLGLALKVHRGVDHGVGHILLFFQWLWIAELVYARLLTLEHGLANIGIPELLQEVALRAGLNVLDERDWV